MQASTVCRQISRSSSDPDIFVSIEGLAMFYFLFQLIDGLIDWVFCSLSYLFERLIMSDFLVPTPPYKKTPKKSKKSEKKKKTRKSRRPVSPVMPDYHSSIIEQNTASSDTIRKICPVCGTGTDTLVRTGLYQVPKVCPSCYAGMKRR